VSFLLNLFGTGIRYWICDIPTEQFNEMEQIRVKHSVEREELLCDFDFLKHYGYAHWSELSSYPEQKGFYLNSHNKAEIKEKNRFIARFKAEELMNTNALFPLYKTFNLHSNFPNHPATERLIIKQEETGLFAKYELFTEDFLIEELQFQLEITEQYSLLTGIKYPEISIIEQKEDTVITGITIKTPKIISPS
jgi:hypothetical protein